MSPRPPDTFEEEMAQLADDYAQAWRFETDGPLIIGVVISFSEWDAGWGTYPILGLRLADGTERAVHCQHEVLQRELSKARPRIGERVGIKWLGTPEDKSYHRYRVRVDRPEGHEIDWSRYGSGVEELPPARSAPPTPGELAAAAQIGDPGAPVLDDGEDIPFFWDGAPSYDERRCHGSRW